MRIASKRVYHGIIDLIPSTTEKTFILATGRPGGVLEIVLLAMNARGTANIKNTSRVLKIRGVEIDLDAPIDIDSGKALTYVDPIYLTDGHEFGVRLDGETNVATCRVLIHWIYHIDEFDLRTEET